LALTARPQPKAKQRELFEEFDPYAVRPEDALEAARREVKQWRMEQLATVKRQHHLDAIKFGARTVACFEELLAALDILGEPCDFPLDDWPDVAVSVIA